MKAEGSHCDDGGGAPDCAWEQWQQPWLSGGHWGGAGYGVDAPPLLPGGWGGGASPAAAAVAAAAWQNWMHGACQWGPPAFADRGYAAAAWDPTRPPYPWDFSPAATPTPGAASSSSPLQVAWPPDPRWAPQDAQTVGRPPAAHTSADPEAVPGGSDDLKEADTLDARHRPWRRPTARLWCYIFLHKRHPEFDIVPMLIGRGGRNMREINTATNAKIRVRGKGSGHLEADGRGEAPVPLMVAVTANHADAEGFKQAIQMTLARLREVSDKYRLFCQNKGLPPPSSQETVFSIGEVSKEAKAMLAGMPIDGEPMLGDRCAGESEPGGEVAGVEADAAPREAYAEADEAPQRGGRRALRRRQRGEQRAHGGVVESGALAASGVAHDCHGVAPFDLTAALEAAANDPWAGWKPQGLGGPPASEDAPGRAGDELAAERRGPHPGMPPHAPPPPPPTLEPAGAVGAAAQANSDDNHNLEDLIASEVSAFLNNSGADSDSSDLFFRIAVIHSGIPPEYVGERS
ncbi:unnamed protein product [Prorocentrum cordatum]|uniref:KHDC4/BBP-like KH-domain type I domain-containing protein n=1 Tax=Prorocentrum cordatum TaxID=2364126 RepID=A0ABN9RB44_9DINO|nr:unnamed protein product [Polarella glacialis]